MALSTERRITFDGNTALSDSLNPRRFTNQRLSAKSTLIFQSVIAFPNCKINLGLHVVARRSDGYHDLDTVFIPIDIKDAIEIIRVDRTDDSPQYSSSGAPVDSDPAHNLCIKAYHLLKKDYPDLPPVKLHLHKTIPAGAGLGGGSSDGAFTLILLNTKFNLGLSTDQLISYALQLGSDCPFFIYNRPCFAAGRGELLEPVSIDLSAYKYLVVNPGIHISTAHSFSGLSPASPSVSMKEAIQEPVHRWKELIKNDFEPQAFTNFPQIKQIKDELYELGAIYASMSGSGSTVYGIFEKEKKVAASFPQHYFVRESNLFS